VDRFTLGGVAICALLAGSIINAPAGIALPYQDCHAAHVPAYINCEDNFLRGLQAMSINFPDGPAAAIAAGHEACKWLSQAEEANPQDLAHDKGDVDAQVSKAHGLSMGQAITFVNTAAGNFCVQTTSNAPM
jgi:hypothetical protein